MKKLILITILSFVSSVSWSKDNSASKTDCLRDTEESNHIRTAKRLAVVNNHRIDNVIINLYGIPIWEGMIPTTAGGLQFE